jgi:hypothetical protein
MFKSEQYRARAAEYGDLAKQAAVPSETKDFHKLQQSFTTLAQNEEWLANNYERTVHAADNRNSGSTLAEEEEHVLRCLGAAVIMQWNAIPTKLQRELFDTASSMGSALNTAPLRQQIARFLHKHKDEPAHANTHRQVSSAHDHSRAEKRDIAEL